LKCVAAVSESAVVLIVEVHANDGLYGRLISCVSDLDDDFIICCVTSPEGNMTITNVVCVEGR
jgi:hypothetical protein